MKRIRIHRNELRKASRRWWRTWVESRIATLMAGMGIAVLCAGMALYLIRHPLCFAFLATGPIFFLAAILFEIIGGRTKR
ncbi:MAG: hypothetical protein V1873_08855 [Verrucomicrobiota bacterium]